MRRVILFFSICLASCGVDSGSQTELHSSHHTLARREAPASFKGMSLRQIAGQFGLSKAKPSGEWQGQRGTYYQRTPVARDRNCRVRFQFEPGTVWDRLSVEVYSPKKPKIRQSYTLSSRWLTSLCQVQGDSLKCGARDSRRSWRLQIAKTQGTVIVYRGGALEDLWYSVNTAKCEGVSFSI